MRSAFVYAPGGYPGRVHFRPENYNPVQEKNYWRLQRFIYSKQNAMSNTLMPTPGKKRDMKDFDEYQKKALGAWEKENHRTSGKSRVVEKEDFPHYAWMCLHEQIRG